MRLFKRACRHQNLTWAAPTIKEIIHIDLWTGKEMARTQEFYQLGTCPDCGFARERKVK